MIGKIWSHRGPILQVVQEVAECGWLEGVQVCREVDVTMSVMTTHCKSFTKILSSPVALHQLCAIIIYKRITFFFLDSWLLSFNFLYSKTCHKCIMCNPCPHSFIYSPTPNQCTRTVSAVFASVPAGGHVHTTLCSLHLMHMKID